MVRKFFVKLMGWKEQRANFPQRRTLENFQDQQKLESELAKERQGAIREGQWQEVQLPDAEKPEEKETI